MLLEQTADLGELVLQPRQPLLNGVRVLRHAPPPPVSSSRSVLGRGLDPTEGL